MTGNTSPRGAFSTAGLGAAGRLLWRSVLSSFPEGWQADEKDAAILRLAATQADDLARVERAIRQTGALAVGSRGQKVPNPLLAEARQARTTIGRLLAQIPAPNPERDKPERESPRTRRARRAALSRPRKQEAV